MGKAAEAWAKFQALRSDVLERGREVASLTIPALLLPEGTNDTSRLPTPYQSTGAEGINNIAAKLLMSLYPPGVPGFRLVVDRAAVLKQAAEEAQAGDESAINDDQLISKIEANVGRWEQMIYRKIESLGLRPELYEGFRHQAAVGNYLYRWEGEDAMTLRGFPLDQYVVKRDAAGNVLWVIVQESDPTMANPDDPHLYSAAERLEPPKSGKDKGKVRYRLWQERGEQVMAVKTVSEEDFPYILPVLYRRPGESYGRGLGEQYLGALISLEALASGIVLSSSAAAHLVWLVNPNGFTNIRDLQRAKTGAFVSGLPDDVAPMRLEKNADLSITAATAERIERTLNRVFLLNSAVQRDAERVTAEEIRFVAQELEVALGGAYSLLSEQLQLPIVQWVMKQMIRSGDIPDLPESLVTPKVVTGLEGLGRNLELDRLRMANGVLLENLPPEIVYEYVNVREFTRRVFTSAGVDEVGLIRSEEEVQAARQQAAQEQMAQNIAPPIAGGAAGVAAQVLADQLTAGE